MRVELIQQKNPAHRGICSAVSWTTTGEMYSGGDDRRLCKWNSSGELVSTVCELRTAIVCIDCFRSPSVRRAGHSGIFVVGCSDGSLKIVSESGRIERSVKTSHEGAIVCIRWSWDGSTFVTAGEDGQVLLWSQGGSLRNSVARIPGCVYDLSFNSTSERLALCSGSDLVILRLHDRGPQELRFQAHNGNVLQVDWNSRTDLLATCGEDLTYCIFDKYGRRLFRSRTHSNVLTALRWNPRGDMLCVGCYGFLKICDQNGFPRACLDVDGMGSPMSICWNRIDSMFACGSGSGSVVFGRIGGMAESLEWNQYVVDSVDRCKIRITEILGDAVEEIDFRDELVRVSIGFEHLIVVTLTQCYVYHVKSLSSPHVFDIKEPVSDVVQSSKNFLLTHGVSGVSIHAYDGRLMRSPKLQDVVLGGPLALSRDILAVVGRKSPNVVRFYRLSTGRQITGATLVHSMRVTQIVLSRGEEASAAAAAVSGSSAASGSSRKRETFVAFVDRNGDLYISPILQTNSAGGSGPGGRDSAKPRGAESERVRLEVNTVMQSGRHRTVNKLASMVDSVCWNDRCDMLVAVADSNMVTWMYPQIVYVDRDLLPFVETSVAVEDLGKRSRILSCDGTRCRIKLWKGSVVTFPLSSYPGVLTEVVEAGRWQNAIRLCRFVEDQSLWAMLAAMSIRTGESQLKTAEVALAAIGQVDKLRFIQHIKDIPSVEGRRAELALYMRKVDLAETILLQADLTYRAIKLNIKLYRWERALELSQKYGVHVDTVLWFRERYNNLFNNGQEPSEFFCEVMSQGVEIDAAAIREKIQAEKEKERQRRGSAPL